jgi:hypothetical protein
MVTGQGKERPQPERDDTGAQRGRFGLHTDMPRVTGRKIGASPGGSSLTRSVTRAAAKS